MAAHYITTLPDHDPALILSKVSPIYALAFSLTYSYTTATAITLTRWPIILRGDHARAAGADCTHLVYIARVVALQ